MFNKFRKILIIALISVLSLPVTARVLELSSSTPEYTEQALAEVYKPSKLLIGAETGFIIKAEPSSNVALIIASDKKGENIIGKIDGLIGQKGIAELKLELPDDEQLINRIVYFEVVVWKNEDLSDIQRARIISSDGIQTGSNSLLITGKPESKVLPGFGPAMPGIGDVSRAMDALKDKRNYSEDAYYYNKPLILRNLRAPELKEQPGPVERDD